MHRDSIAMTIIVAFSVCLVCSLLVSVAAIGLRDLQRINRELDIKKNILEVAGFDEPAIAQGGGIEEVFSRWFDTVVIDLETGEEALEEMMQVMGFTDEQTALLGYDQFSASKRVDAEGRIASRVERGEDIARIRSRERYGRVFLQRNEEGEIVRYVFPIRGQGMWDLLKGFIALEPDLRTVAGITYYEHKETPGLGGEVDQDSWKESWQGKQLFDEERNVALRVVKGQAETEHQIDGLAGATITGRGVTNMIRYWLSEEGYLPYIERHRETVATGSDTGDQATRTLHPNTLHPNYVHPNYPANFAGATDG